MTTNTPGGGKRYKPAPLTNYRKAWNDFRKSKEYATVDNALKSSGIKQPYRNNIIEISFSAGWRASGVKIKFIQP